MILEKTIRIPRSLSVKAATVLKAFLEKKPLERLGCSRDRENAFMDIVNHPFFKSIDWESVSLSIYCEKKHTHEKCLNDKNEREKMQGMNKTIVIRFLHPFR